MFRLLYSALLTLISWWIPLVARINHKTKVWYKGRKNQKLPSFDQSPIWIHCASLGEFEQGRPLIEAIKNEWPAIPIVLTFFSASGYEVRKEYDKVDWVGYLTLDLPRNAERFVTIIHPRLVIFVKYEYWFNHLLALNKNKIPYLFISNVWRPHYFPLKWWAGWFLKVIKNGEAFFVQDQISFDLLKKHNFSSVFLVGDTRIDRVMELINHPKKINAMSEWGEGRQIIIGGSTWHQDEIILSQFYARSPNLSLILAPHDPSPDRLEEVFKLFGDYKPCFYSKWQGEPVSILIVDSIGLLNRLYAYAVAAFIGGGFDKGIHNTLEAAVYGIPVFFGPKNKNFKEAQDLLDEGLAFEVNNSLEMNQKWSEIVPAELPRIKQQLTAYFIRNEGATAKIIAYLRGFIQA